MNSWKSGSDWQGHQIRYTDTRWCGRSAEWSCSPFVAEGEPPVSCTSSGTQVNVIVTELRVSFPSPLVSSDLRTDASSKRTSSSWPDVSSSRFSCSANARPPKKSQSDSRPHTTPLTKADFWLGCMAKKFYYHVKHESIPRQGIAYINSPRLTETGACRTSGSRRIRRPSASLLIDQYLAYKLFQRIRHGL
jgi:hypothetical protein